MDYVPVYADEQPAAAGARAQGTPRSRSAPRGCGSPACRRRRRVASALARTSARSAAWSRTRRGSATSTPRSPAGSRSCSSTSPASWCARASRSSRSTRRSCSRPRRSTCGRARPRRGSRRPQLPEVRSGGEDLLEAARRRLELFDVPDELHRRARADGRASSARSRSMAPVSGFVTAKDVFEGQQVEPGMELFTITDLSRVWVEADFYEYEAAASAARRRRRRSTLPYDPTRALERPDRATSTPPSTPDTRTLRSASSSPTPAWRSSRACSPTSSSTSRPAKAIVIPDSAVIDTGERQIVFVRRRRRALRAARGRRSACAAAARSQVLVRARGGEQVVDPRQLPARLRVAAARRHRRRWARDGHQHGGAAMIQRIIEFSAQQPAPGAARRGRALRASPSTPSSEIRLDALPDLSDTQVIVYSRWDRSPDIIEDQVTYPIVSALLGAPQGQGDPRLLRLRLLLRLRHLPGRHRPLLGALAGARVPVEDPAAPARGGADRAGPGRHRRRLGLPVRAVDRSGTHSLDELRSYQDWTLRYALQSVPGRGRGRLDRRLRQAVPDHRRPQPARRLRHPARRWSSRRCGAPTTRSAAGCSSWRGAEYMVRGRGYAQHHRGLRADRGQGRRRAACRCCCEDVARVELGPEIRRGVSDLDGQGDAVGGIVVMRHGENALNVIERVKDEARRSSSRRCPTGVEVVTTYDRSDLIHRAIDTLKHELTVEMIIVSLVILLFLWHIPSAIVPIVTIPISVLLAFIPLLLHGRHGQHHVAGRHRHLDRRAGRRRHRRGGERLQQAPPLAGRRAARGTSTQVRLEALKEVGPSVFFSLLVIAVAFLPVFALVDQEGRLFKPLAFSKNLAMALAALLAITLDPAMRMMFARMDPFTFRPRCLAWLATRRSSAPTTPRRSTRSAGPLRGLRAGLPLRAALPQGGDRRPRSPWSPCRVPVYFKLGHGVHAAAERGLDPLHADDAARHLGGRRRRSCCETQDRVLKSFPEVERVFGKAGRAETSTDPAPFSMMETTVVLKPRGPVARPSSAGTPSWAPDWLQAAAAADLARPHLLGGAGRRDGPGPADPRRHQRLDDADQGPHRHAHHRRPHPGRHQGLRRRPRRRSSASASSSRASCATSRAPAASSPSGSPAATSSTSSRAATSSPATASPSPTCRM